MQCITGSSNLQYAVDHFSAPERSIVGDEHVCVCVRPRSYLHIYTSDLHQFFVHVTYGHGSILLWWRSDTLHALHPVLWMTWYLLISQVCSTSLPSWSAAHMQPWAWLQTMRINTSCRPTDARDYFSGLKVTSQVEHWGWSLRSMTALLSMKSTNFFCK